MAILTSGNGDLEKSPRPRRPIPVAPAPAPAPPLPGPSAEHDVGGGAAVGPWAVAELGRGRLEVSPFFDAFYEQLLDVLDGRLRQSVGLGVVWAAGLVEDAVVLAVRLEGLAAKLRCSARANGFGEAEVLNHFLMAQVTGREVVVVKRCTHVMCGVFAI